MEVLCPDCNTPLTPSIVGYLCHGCGNVHSFEKISDATKSGNLVSTQINRNNSKTNQNSSHFSRKSNVASKTSKHSFSHKLKKAFVPEITEN